VSARNPAQLEYTASNTVIHDASIYKTYFYDEEQLLDTIPIHQNDTISIAYRDKTRSYYTKHNVIHTTTAHKRVYYLELSSAHHIIPTPYNPACPNFVTVATADDGGLGTGCTRLSKQTHKQQRQQHAHTHTHTHTHTHARAHIRTFCTFIVSTHDCLFIHNIV
jgi:hypothetical protein